LRVAVERAALLAHSRPESRQADKRT
jgi:hypothetical protein